MLRRGAWFAVLPLLVLQVAAAVHQFDHSAEYVEDCRVCMQLDRIDTAVDFSSQSEMLPAADTQPLMQASAMVHAIVLRNFDTRAPPHL